MIIREERPEDVDAIHALTDLAFAPMPFGDGTEAPIIRQLRQDGDLTISLVAEKNGRIVGHVACSPLTIEGIEDLWFGLGPISVTPDLQRTGIGTALVKHGIDRLDRMGAYGCALIGNPSVYGPMGFRSNGKLTYRGLEAFLVQFLLLRGKEPVGEIKFAAAFDLDPTGN